MADTTDSTTLAQAFDDWNDVDAPPLDPLVAQHREWNPKCFRCEEFFPKRQISPYCRGVLQARGRFEEATNAIRKRASAAIALRTGLPVRWRKDRLKVGDIEIVASIALHFSDHRIESYVPGQTLRVTLGGWRSPTRLREPKGGFDIEKVADAALSEVWTRAAELFWAREREEREATGKALRDRLERALDALGWSSLLVQKGGAGALSVCIAGDDDHLESFVEFLTSAASYRARQ